MKDETAIYVRVSTMKDSQKDSPEHQLGICEEKANALHLHVKFIYEDRDTGTSIVARNEIQRLIADAKHGRIKNIIFASLSRFSRDTLDSLNLKRVLVDALGIRLISIEEGYDSAKDNDELKFQIISAVNQKLSEQISLSSKRGIRQSALKGNFTGSITPYGYKKVMIGNRKTLTPDDETKSVVQMIYKLYTTDKLGVKAIVNYLNEKEIPSHKAGVWGISSVQRILMNEVYTGNNVFSKYEMKKIYNDINNMADRSKKQVQRDKETWERSAFKTHEPIIEDETFHRAQEIRLQRSGGARGGIRNRVNLFAGIIFCTHCGSAMVMMKSNGSKSRKEIREYRYLICSTRRRQGEKGCVNNLSLPYDNVRHVILDEISQKLKIAVPIETIVNDSIQRIKKNNIAEETKGKETKRLEKAIDTNRNLLFQLRKQKMLDDLDEQQYSYEKEMYEREIGSMQQRLDHIKGVNEETLNLHVIREEIRTAIHELVELRFDNQDPLRLILNTLIKQITVNVTGEVEIQTPLALV
ncbi:recombinase family protein [Paenibacillus terrigena]|uniref:recombinase family protein n=1 Tax=Paenibacillus terrigena TaxID=369333 RepID=UPI00036A5AB4|nr:recombinase family protein [Paenibacillus terrigena]